ncbi:hypothetical protein [Rosettibacter firmus]|uniref:hypothetical protein n=1 Tax=Rosettibacter firmus TaxID=3111522 RepID=UPI00336C234E
MQTISLEYLKKKLHTNKNIKLREVRLINRMINRINEDVFLNFGDIWALHDRHISFGQERRNYKDANRPVVILDNSVPYTDYHTVLFAPGTTRVHKYEPTILIAKVPPERLKKTTFFLIHYKEYRYTRLFERKLTELSYKLKNKLTNILDTSYGGRNSNS